MQNEWNLLPIFFERVINLDKIWKIPTKSIHMKLHADVNITNDPKRSYRSTYSLCFQLRHILIHVYSIFSACTKFVSKAIEINY